MLILLIASQKDDWEGEVRTDIHLKNIICKQSMHGLN